MADLLEPAAGIISRFGGADKVIEITGASRTRVYRWMRPKNEGGTGGVIPMAQAMKLLQHARDHAVPVTADDFLPARAVA
jgi:DNA-binding phage protein